MLRFHLYFLIICCSATFLFVSCGVSGKTTTSSDQQFVSVTQIYGSGYDQITDDYFKYLPADGIDTGSKVIFSENTLGKGLVAYHYHYEDLFASVQDVSVIEIDPRRYKFRVADHKGLKRTSEMAIEAGAVAEMNGTFYDMKKGGSVCYLQIDGVVADTTKGKDMKVRTNGAVVIRKGKLSIEPWSQEKENFYRYCFAKDLNSANNSDGIVKIRGKHVSVMATMPLLIKDGYAVELPYYKGFSDKRHPRSVVFEKDGKICLMVIDGRSKGNAAGMTLDEVQRYLLSIDGGKGCRNAVNMDGGGSSTLWLKEVGVLNHPSDNGKYDHKGERRVANSIIVLRR
ncbi:MAG: phosphodiester glycosidase family protein [Bacteroidales bacterium]|nr:phosphodiester glycosidase family protein [Bacteroidales bacterium]